MRIQLIAIEIIIKFTCTTYIQRQTAAMFVVLLLSSRSCPSFRQQPLSKTHIKNYRSEKTAKEKTEQQNLATKQQNKLHEKSYQACSFGSPVVFPFGRLARLFSSLKSIHILSTSFSSGRNRSQRRLVNSFQLICRDFM